MHAAHLCQRKDVVVGVSVLPDLRRHAVKAPGACFGARQRQVGDRARDPPVAVVKGMTGDEPKVDETGFENLVHIAVRIELN